MKNKLNRFHNTKNKYNYSDYTVGWICALGKELAAARSMLDKEHECLPSRDGDKNGYVFGQIGDHNVVLTCLPMAMMGNNPATAAAVDMLRSFPSIKHGLMVGIGGGVPSDKHDIRLGDVVVSVPTDQDSGVVQYDFGKTIAEGRFIRTGTLNKPPIDLLTALQRFISTAEPSAEQILQQHVDGAKKNQARRFEYPGQQFDRLFDPAYDHQETSLTCEECNCDANRVKRRPTRPNTLPRIFRGTIASGNQVMKHGRTRDQLAKASNILCFDMEAAGLMDRFPCLVIRGISDYADSHKNDCWQDYAAVVAAAFAKALLLSIRAEKDSMSIEDQLLKALLVADGDVVPNNTRACPETCNWILDHAAFRDWKNAQSITATLWIKGGPGCGKSVMSSFVVEELQRHFVSDEESLHPVPGRTVVARHFCGDKNDPRHASTSILKSLLYEILSQDQALLQRTLLPLLQIEDPAVSEQGGPLNTQMFELFEFLKKTLEAVANDPTIAAIYFIVDGLDRCGVHALEFLQLINQGPGLFNGKASLRCLISSRPSDFLNRNMQPQCIIDLSKENRQDINTVVKLRMKDLQELYRFPDDLRDRIEELLRERSDGMFLWLSLVLDRLRDLTIWDEMIVKEKLQSIPFDVNAIYSNVLECARKESDETASRLQTLLMWVYLAAEPPLKVDQIQIVWALQDGDKSMEDVKGKHQFLKLDTIRKYIRECWSTLIVLRDDDTLWLSHQSVKDFLRHLFSGHGQEQMPAYGITVQEAHERMASTCLTYLCLNEIRELTVPGLPINSDGMIDVARREILVKNYLNGHHLLGYSILFLGLHLRESKMDSRQVDIPGMDSFLAAESGALKKWVRAYDLLKRSTHGKCECRIYSHLREGGALSLVQ
jgi:nucleoside phosphorylase